MCTSATFHEVCRICYSAMGVPRTSSVSHDVSEVLASKRYASSISYNREPNGVVLADAVLSIGFGKRESALEVPGSHKPSLADGLARRGPNAWS